MKKICLLIMFVILASCTSNYHELNEVESNEPEYESQNYGYAHPITIPITLTNEHFFARSYDENGMLFFDEDGIVIHYIDWDRPGIDVVRLTSDGIRHNLYSFTGAFPRWHALAFDSYANHYVPLIFTREDFTDNFAIIKFNASLNTYEEKESKIIWESKDSLAVNFFIESDIMIILAPHDMDSYRKFDIVKLDLSSGDYQVILTKSLYVPLFTGDRVFDIFVENSRIYMFRRTIDSRGDRHYIDVYDFYGNKIISYPLDLLRFIFLPSIGDRDSELDFFKFHNYFIFNTLNRRVAIFKLVDNELVRVELPRKFQELGFTLFNDNLLSDNSGLMYFSRGGWREKHIHVMDSLQEQLFLLDITIQYPEMIIDFLENGVSFERDIEGNIMIAAQVVGWYPHERLIEQKRQDAYTAGISFNEENIPPPFTYFYYFLSVDEIKEFLR
ncbi:MAG: hypothetical protein FWC91_10435 [Defluviitaleaceae bacterium]|nr:hypothetical protein [Defluviitaleaceae bacterium]